MKDIRLFQILDVMNVQDTENKTSHLGVCNTLLSAHYVAKTRGTEVAIGVPGNVTGDIFEGKVLPILLMISLKEYTEIKAKLEENG